MSGKGHSRTDLKDNVQAGPAVRQQEIGADKHDGRHPEMLGRLHFSLVMNDTEFCILNAELNKE